MDTSDMDDEGPTYMARADIEEMEWLARLKNNRRLPNSTFYPLLAAYAIMILFGVIANSLIISLILRQRSRCATWCVIN